MALGVTLPVLRGNFGSTEYFLTAMEVGDFIGRVSLPTELPDWETLSVEEKFQREISLRRVRNEIAPYFATDADRFSGSLVLAVMHHQDMEYEPLSTFGFGGGQKRISATYRSASQDMGFLTLTGKEVLVPLDGQHRAKAFKFAMEGSDDKGRAIPGLKANLDLAKDQVTVILVRFETEHSRYIFNKINRYAKPTGKSDVIITDDDNAIAVINRQLAGPDGVIPVRLVRIGSNTLPASAVEFTTLATLYDCNYALADNLKLVGKGKLEQMTPPQRELAKRRCREAWVRLFSKVELWAKALSDPNEGGDATRKEIRAQTLLGKPIGQLSLVRGYLIMKERCERVPEDTLCQRLNLINWGVDAPMWHGVLMNPNGRVMSGRGAVSRASEFIAHLGGVKLTDEETQRLLEHIHGNDWENHQLPDPVA